MLEPNNQDLSLYSAASREATRLGGQVLLKWLGKITVREKGFRDLVTQADLESQTVIRDFLAKEFPQHSFLGEETLSEAVPQPSSEFRWIVDPLDGTTNYVHQLRSFAVSVALYFQNRAVVGTVFDPVLDECFSATKGLGASLNGQTIHTSICTELGKSLFVFSLRSGIKRQDPDVIRFLNLLENAGSTRRLGSAALNLCYVACGRVDGYWATSLAQWDVAAGWLIATEAGATLADFTGAKIDVQKPHFCITATPELFAQIKPLLDV